MQNSPLINIRFVDDFNIKDGSKKFVDPQQYQRLTQEEQILLVPDTYIGSVEKVERQERIAVGQLIDPKSLDHKEIIIKNEIIHLPEGVERLFLEILSNAADNVQRSRERNINIGNIRITMDRQQITIRNEGLPIPVVIHEKEKIYVPEMIFGNLLTSSNYNQYEEKRVVGKNGYGAKLCNLFSLSFQVKIGDEQHHVEYFQQWKDHMKIKSQPLIESYSGSSYVEISYLLDFQRFGYDQYPEEALSLFLRHSIDVSFTCKIPVYFNNYLLDFRDIKRYAQLLFSHINTDKDGLSDEKKEPNLLVHYENENQDEVPPVELCWIDTPDEATTISFVNGMMTRDGGVHVEAAYKIINENLIHVINGIKNGRSSKLGLIDSKNDPLLKNFSIKQEDIKRHLSLIISCRLINPKFNSQSKTKLSGPRPKIVFNEKELKQVNNWSFVQRLYVDLQNKMMSLLTKGEGKRKKWIDDPDNKLVDCNWVKIPGTTEKCVLYIVEGDSALGFADSAIELVPNGRDFIGTFPLKGVPLNVRNCNFVQFLKNKELHQLKEALGLREGVNYLENSEYQTLRYGHLLIMTDADEDGHHIRGLIILFFETFFPSLLERGYVKFLRTTLLKVISKHGEIKRFYTRNEYQEWKKSTMDWKDWETKYYKGLGTNKPGEDIEAIFQNPKVIEHFRDFEAHNNLELAFCKLYSDQRKKWLANYQDRPEIEDLVKEPISFFVNYELIIHSLANVYRSIPGFDGQKPGQRKAIWTAYKLWGKKIGKGKLKEKKVSELASAVNVEVSYHHGEASMEKTIIGMAQNFIGSNNMNLFSPEGNFGKRTNFKASSSRYISTFPEWWWSYIFREEDEDILDIIEDEGKLCEPRTLLPIIPLSMVNGADGIGTGYSTFIPKFNPLNLCQWLLVKLNNIIHPSSSLVFPELKPWYRGFMGKIEVSYYDGLKNSHNFLDPSKLNEDNSNNQMIEDNSNNQEVEDNSNNQIVEDNSNSNHRDIENESLVFYPGDEKDPLGPDEINCQFQSKSMITEGCFHIDGKKVIVDEIPIGRSIKQYHDFLDKLRIEKQIKDIDFHTGKDDTFRFEINGLSNPSIKNLRLRRVFGLTNMILIDPEKKPVKFESITNIIETFFQWRLGYYQRRKDRLLNKIQDKNNNLDDKIRFIQAVIQGYQDHDYDPGKNIILMKNHKDKVYQAMDLLHLPHKLLKEVDSSCYTLEEIEILRKRKEDLDRDYRELQSISKEQLWINDLQEFVKVYQQHDK